MFTNKNNKYYIMKLARNGTAVNSCYKKTIREMNESELASLYYTSLNKLKNKLKLAGFTTEEIINIIQTFSR